MDRRFGIVIVAGVAVAAACAWRAGVNRPQDLRAQMSAAKMERPAPPFESLDIHNTMFRLERYLGRHRVLVVFFSAEATAAHDSGLLAVRRLYGQLARSDVKVVGVSTALPQDNRRAIETTGEYPFPLVSDPDLSIHRRWGRLDARTEQPMPGVFLIDRKGSVATFGDAPQPVADLSATLEELTH